MAAYETAIVVEDYTPKNDDEIALVKGEKVMIRAFNNNARTAQGENAKGELGWFPEQCIAVQVQQVNALDFLAQSMSADEKKAAMVSPRVDTASLMEKKKQTEERLSTFLTQKPPRKLLVDKNILTQASDSDEIKGAQEMVMKEKESKRAKLEKFYLSKVDEKKKKKDAKEMPDKELDALIQVMMEIPIESKKGKSGFSGKVLMDWLLENKYATDKSDVTALINMLLNKLVVYDTSDRTSTKFSPKDFYNLMCRNVEFGPMNLDKVYGDEDPGDALTLSCDLLTALMKYMQNKKLDFGNMRTDPQFVKLSLRLSALQKCSLDSLSYGDKEAFWINIYNLMVLFVYCRLCPPTTRSDRQLIFDKCYFTIGRANYTLTEVRENVILGLSQFAAKDKRSVIVIGEKDKNRKALFLFGLPDGTESAPGFYVYNAQNLESKLKEAAMVFLENKLVVDDSDLKIKAPSLVRGFKRLGIKDDDGIQLLAEYMLPSKAKIMREQPGFDLEIDSTSSQEPCYLFDSAVVGSD